MDTGTLTAGSHRVKIWCDTTNIAGTYISIDAFDVLGTLNQGRAARREAALHSAWNSKPSLGPLTRDRLAS